MVTLPEAMGATQDRGSSSRPVRRRLGLDRSQLAALLRGLEAAATTTEVVIAMVGMEVVDMEVEAGTTLDLLRMPVGLRLGSKAVVVEDRPHGRRMETEGMVSSRAEGTVVAVEVELRGTSSRVADMVLRHRLLRVTICRLHRLLGTMMRHRLLHRLRQIHNSFWDGEMGAAMIWQRLWEMKYSGSKTRLNAKVSRRNWVGRPMIFLAFDSALLLRGTDRLCSCILASMATAFLPPLDRVHSRASV